MATALPIRFGARGSPGRGANPASAAPLASHRRQACSPSARLAPVISTTAGILTSVISITAGLLPVLVPVILALAFT